MISVTRPLVSIVTPVYNGETYLVECIESVMAQSHENWEYIIVDNCSTDRTLEISRSYADRDTRIRVSTNTEFLPLLSNWNQAIRQISAASKYCKVVHADDWLFRDCVRQMVELAEQNPSVGIVAAYRLDEDRINLDGLPYPSTVVSGREIGRWHLLGGSDLFGSPTSLLLRADLVRARQYFYNEKNLHADTEVCIDLLRHTDFGFVHQVLTFTRRHNEAVTSYARRLNTYMTSALYVLQKYGRDFLGDEEYQRTLRERLQRYYRFLGWKAANLVRTASRVEREEFWKFHKQALLDLGHPLNVVRLVRSVVVVLYNALLDRLKMD